MTDETFSLIAAVSALAAAVALWSRIRRAQLMRQLIRSFEKQNVVLPDGFNTVTPRIVARNADRLVAFIRQVFNATGDYQPARPSELRIGDSVIMISDAAQRKPTSALLYVYVPDTDATYRLALQCGAHSLEEPFDTPYGDRRCMVKDEWGNTWQIATRR